MRLQNCFLVITKSYYYYSPQNLHRGIVTLKVRVRDNGGPSSSTFTTPAATPIAYRRRTDRQPSDTASETSNSSVQDSPTMLRKLRNKKNRKLKATDIVLTKGE